MTKSKIYIAALAMLFCLGACSNWEELNMDPNNPPAEKVSPALKVGGVFKESCMNAELHQRVHNLYVDMFAQYYLGYFGTYDYVSNDPWTTLFWENHYKWFNSLNVLVMDYESNEDFTNIVSIIRIWKVWISHRGVDLLGDIPYFEVADGVYDAEELIYKDFLKELEESVANFDASKESMNDPIYHGDLGKWTKFANSLRLRLAMRLTNVEPELAKQHAEAAVAGGVLESFDEMPTMFSNTTAWGEGYSYNYYFWWGAGNGVVMSQSFYDLTVNIGGVPFKTTDVGDRLANGEYPEFVDPRATVIFGSSDQNAENSEIAGYQGRWSGIAAGLASPDRAEEANRVQNNSRINVTLRGKFNGDNAREFTILPIAEIWFLRAEGASYGWNMAVPTQDAYENGVRASFDYWGLKSADTYLASEAVNNQGISAKWGDGNGTELEKIITQKYIGGYPDNGWEAWADLRRLELPELEFGLQLNTNVPEGKIIQRVKYPLNQAQVNGDNYNQVKDKDTEGHKHWWSK
ncbi:SusD/RagB family nutrient-binding outer membrane lipoprotein [Rapidithrix thailandica]|uniref:SusD/RagB family nutrient-binding outer membrane lipoprotein n=1 Tax=Rapidithrix thailandica TaxID=413964 RepID=A0AAW9SDD5_9BACT